MSKAMCMLKWTGKFIGVFIVGIVVMFGFLIAAGYVACAISNWLFGGTYISTMLILMGFLILGASIVLAYVQCYIKKSSNKEDPVIGG